MRCSRLILLMGALLLPAALASAAPKPAPATALAKDGWPDSNVGALARRWIIAFSAGEKSMREAIPQLLSAASLAKRDMDSRMETYRTLHDRFGSLILASVDSSGVDELKVTLAASDLKQYHFTFTADPAPPHRLSQVSLSEYRNVGHAGGFHH
jgi:hypothetical protein